MSRTIRNSDSSSRFRHSEMPFHSEWPSLGESSGQTTRNKKSSLPTIRHPLSTKGNVGGLEVTQPVTALHPFVPSVPRTDPPRTSRSHAPLRETRTMIDRKKLPAERRTQKLASLKEENSVEESVGSLLPPIDRHEAKKDSESEDSEEEEEEEVEEEPLVVPSRSDLVAFPPIGNPHAPFPATIFQWHAFLDHETALEDVDARGRSTRADNLVRLFSVHGPLDAGFVKRALHRVALLHPLLKARFLRAKDHLFVQIPSGRMGVDFEARSVSRHSPEDVLRHEQHRLFSIPTETISDDVADLIKRGEGEEEARQAKVTSKTYLFRVRLFTRGPFDHVLAFSFPRVVADFWSASLFVRQVATAYGREERSAVATRSRNALAQKWSRNFLVAPTRFESPDEEDISTDVSTSCRLTFRQVCLREVDLGAEYSKERLWSLWQAAATKTVRNHKGELRQKPVPHVKLPKHLKDAATASTSSTWKPKKGLECQDKIFKFLKIDELVGECFLQTLSSSLCPDVDRADLLYFMCLGCYAVLLGRCCRGWNGNQPPHVAYHDSPFDATSGTTTHRRPSAVGGRQKSARNRRASLMSARTREMKLMTLSPPGSGHFLVGAELSVRRFANGDADELFGPLTNDAFIRVNLSVCRTFVDLVNLLAKTVKGLHRQVHFPFASVASDVDVPQSLPVRFVYLSRRDVDRVANPDGFYFAETAVGVSGQGLARMGSSCYLSPLNGRLDKSELELVLWENTENDGLGGGFRFQSRALPAKSVDSLIRTYGELVEAVADHPTILLNDLVSVVRPPFLPNRRQRLKSAFHKNPNLSASI